MWAGALLVAATAIATWSAWTELGGAALRHLALQCAAAFIAVAIALHAGLGSDAAFRLGALATVCTAIARIDRQLLLIPDVLVLAVLALALAPPAALSLTASALGAAMMGGLFLVVRAAYARLRGGEGLGLGDVKLAAAMGAYLGLEAALLATALAASITGLWVIVTSQGTRPGHPAPLGVGLAATLMLLAVATGVAP